MLERICFTGLLAAGLSLAACSETPLEPTDPTEREPPLTISTAPDPTYAVASTGKTYVVNGQVREYAFLASFDLILQGNPGLRYRHHPRIRQHSAATVVERHPGRPRRRAWTVNAMNSSLVADVDRIEPGGRTTRAFDVWYTLPQGGREAVIAVTLNFIYDDGITFSQVHQVRVQP